ncbi:MAG: hypothetical protein DRI44_04610, partial [Chlamydiae bacterium]
HVRAALLLKEMGEEIHSGDLISYVKCKDGSVQPVELARPEDIDVKKYNQQLKSIFAPLFEPLNINYDSVIEGKKTIIDF